ncbi:MAG TPA: ATP-binding protein [Thermoanaerobaculia bacterium]|nr:ATP-binding protein [Thermoanaerobaculia bacterium]
MNERRPAWPVERTLLLPVAAVLLVTAGVAALVLRAGQRDATASVTRLVAAIARDAEVAPLDPAGARAVVRVLAEHEGVARAEIGTSGAPHPALRATLSPPSGERVLQGTIVSAPIRLTTGVATLNVETVAPAATSAVIPVAVTAIAAAILAALASRILLRRKLLAIGNSLAKTENLPPTRGALGAVVGAANELLARVHDRELALRRRTLELEAANQELEAFAYSVSHDLRAPIGSIDGFSQALEDENLDPMGRECVHWIRDSCRQMSDLVDGLLQMTRLARAELEREELDASALARSVAESLEQREPERAVAFRIEDGVRVNADPRLMRAVLENLMSNAWKFTRKHKSATIEFGVARQNGSAALYVRDDGAGFDPGAAAKMFRAFQRLHSRDEFEGTGIGLATVERILQRHGGKIWAEGEVEKGATFYFTTGSVIQSRADGEGSPASEGASSPSLRLGMTRA